MAKRQTARGFERKLLTRTLGLSQLSYAVLALGDRQYEQFCGFARRVHDWLGLQGAKSLLAPVEVDGEDHQALGRWHEHVSSLTGAAAQPLSAPAWQPWTLTRRACLNPGSQGAPTYLLALELGEACRWEAGDVLQVLPKHPLARVHAWLEQCAVYDAPELWSAPVVLEALGGQTLPLDHALAYHELAGDAARLQTLSAQDLVGALKPLPAREYSIASIPEDGALELIVRQEQRSDGSLGLASGWLTAYAEDGGTIFAKIKRNSNFHAPPDDRPMLLIGNGVGLAGLRSLIKARVLAGHTRNWLLFGERNRAHDFYCQAEWHAWREAGSLQHLDLAFSRDQAERIYVQDRLREAAERLQQWVAQGASLYVCGSLQGMADGVDAVLRAVLGDAQVEQLTQEGRYRRDVF